MSTPFRAEGASPYHEPTDKEERRNQLFREWMHMCGRYKVALQDPPEVNYEAPFFRGPELLTGVRRQVPENTSKSGRTWRKRLRRPISAGGIFGTRWAYDPLYQGKPDFDFTSITLN